MLFRWYVMMNKMRPNVSVANVEYKPSGKPKKLKLKQ